MKVTMLQPPLPAELKVAGRKPQSAAQSQLPHVMQFGSERRLVLLQLLQHGQQRFGWETTTTEEESRVGRRGEEKRGKQTG